MSTDKERDRSRYFETSATAWNELEAKRVRRMLAHHEQMMKGTPYEPFRIMPPPWRTSLGNPTELRPKKPKRKRKIMDPDRVKRRYMVVGVGAIAWIVITFILATAAYFLPAASILEVIAGLFAFVSLIGIPGAIGFWLLWDYDQE